MGGEGQEEALGFRPRNSDLRPLGTAVHTKTGLQICELVLRSTLCHDNTQFLRGMCLMRTQE